MTKEICFYMVIDVYVMNRTKREKISSTTFSLSDTIFVDIRYERRKKGKKEGKVSGHCNHRMKRKIVFHLHCSTKERVCFLIAVEFWLFRPISAMFLRQQVDQGPVLQWSTALQLGKKQSDRSCGSDWTCFKIQFRWSNRSLLRLVWSLWSYPSCFSVRQRCSKGAEGQASHQEEECCLSWNGKEVHRE